MAWILLSILSAFLWAVTNIVDKFVFTKWIKQPALPLFIIGIVGLVGSILIYLVRGFQDLSLFHIFLAIISGILYFISVFLYFKAVMIEEISRVIPFQYLSPLFVLFLALIFLNEVFTPVKYFGIFLLLIGVFVISIRWPFEIKLNRAFWFILLASFIWAINSIIDKYLLGFAEFWTIFSYVRIGMFLSSLITIFFISQETKLFLKNHTLKGIFTFTLNESLGAIASLIYYAALTIGYATLVNSVASTQPFFTLILAIIISIFYPTILKEELNKSSVASKIIAIVFMFIGVILLT